MRFREDECEDENEGYGDGSEKEHVRMAGQRDGGVVCRWHLVEDERT